MQTVRSFNILTTNDIEYNAKILPNIQIISILVLKQAAYFTKNKKSELEQLYRQKPHQSLVHWDWKVSH